MVGLQGEDKVGSPGRLIYGYRRSYLQRIEVDPVKVVDLAFSDLEIPDNIAVTREVAEVNPISIDPSKMAMAIRKLLINAIQAMPEGGELKIRTGRSDPDTVWLEVSDTGHGIPDEIRNHLFEPFFTTKERSRGTGLGLSVVHGIVTRQGGKIQIQSEVGTGSTFRITLPAGTSTLSEDEITGIHRMPSSGGDERILVVEDDIAVRESLADVLAGLGYDVTAVGDCGEAE